MNNKIKIGIVGAGTMGRGIALAAAENGHAVTLYDISNDITESALGYIKGIIHKKVENKKINAARGEKIIQLISESNNFTDLTGSELIIEAVLENIDLKKKIFFELESVVDNKTILASNTSSLSITSIASASKNPAHIIGIHFFNPANVMPLVEIIPGLLTSSETTKCASEIISSWGKTVITVKDSPGFIVNRVARPFYTEALRIMEEGIAKPEEIDWAMKEFGKFKMGPFELMDMIGIDINFSVTESIFNATFFNSRYRPSLIQQQMINANLLGKKSGKGFYNYNTDENPQPEKNLQTGTEVFYRILVMLINEASDALFFKIAKREDIDLAILKGMNFPKGLLAWADEIGIDIVLAKIEELYSIYKEERYRPSPLLLRMFKNGNKFFENR